MIRYTAFFLNDGAVGAVAGFDDDAAALLERIGEDLATADAFGSHEVALIDRDASPADVYRVDVKVGLDGTVRTSSAHIRCVEWCPACESIGHTVHACGVVEDEPEEWVDVTESLGLRSPWS